MTGQKTLEKETISRDEFERLQYEWMAAIDPDGALAMFPGKKVEKFIAKALGVPARPGKVEEK